MTAIHQKDGGIAAVNRNTLRALSSRIRHGKMSRVLSLYDKTEDRPGYLNADCKFIGFDSQRLLFALGVAWAALRGELIVFDHVTLAKCVLPGIRLGVVDAILIAHGSESWRRLRPSSRAAICSSKLTITNSEYTLRKMRESIESFAGKACPLGLSADFVLQPEAPEKSKGEQINLRCADGQMRIVGPIALLLVGRMHPGEREKGTYELLKVIPKLRKRHRDLQMIFCGDGDDRKNLERIANESGIGDCVFFPGRVSATDLSAIYKSCFAFVMPSRQEGFGLVYLEAMNFSKPCVGCTNDGAADVIVDGETGLLVQHDPEGSGVERAIEWLLTHPSDAGAMGVRGYRRLCEHFTSEQFQNRFAAIIDAVISPSR